MDRVLVTRGRYQPYGNHHAAVVDYFADKHDADEVKIVTEGLSDSRMPTSPFLGEEVAEMINSAYREDYETGYEVEAVNQSSLLDDEVFDILDDKPVYFTREKRHAQGFGVLGFLYDLGFWSDAGLEDVDYEPREDQTPFEESDRPIETSSTSIREMISNGNPEWRQYVSDSVEDFVDECDEGRAVIGEPQNGGKYTTILKDSFL